MALYPFFSAVRSRTTTFGSTWITLRGILIPSSLNSWVMPIFLPISASIRAASSGCGTPRPLFSTRYAASLLYFDVHAGGQLQTHQRVHDRGSGLEDVDQPLVRPHLELLTRLLVHVRRAQDRELVDPHGK